MGYKCQRCGACCRMAGRSVIPEIKALALEGSDVCRHLLPNNLCEIYETRPLFCQVDGLYDLIAETNHEMTREEWYRMNHAGCITIRALLGISEPEHQE